MCIEHAIHAFSLDRNRVEFFVTKVSSAVTLSHYISLPFFPLDPETLGHAYVVHGLRSSSAVRCELYVQVMKQLRRNPSPGSVARGWDMITLLLSCFSPPPVVENVVAMFIKEQVNSMCNGCSRTDSMAVEFNLYSYMKFPL